ncbi:MAG: GNAT family N-acetyltransferase [Pseudomonadota bacterium]
MTPALTNTPILETERLILRAPRPEDYAFWEPFYLSRRARFIGGGSDRGTGVAWRAFCHVAGMWVLRGFGSFVVQTKTCDNPLAMAGPWHPADWPERELGWTVWSEDAEGTGIAREAAEAARRFAYEVLDWDTAVSYIHRDNTRSIRLAERLGCTHDAAAVAPGDDDLVFRHPAPEVIAP